MKSKRARHDTSSEDSGESEDSVESLSSSDSESDESSDQRRKSKKKRKHMSSSESDSESDDAHKKSKKRKHKKKKKRHSKKKRRHDSEDDSDSGLSESDEDVHKMKKKQKHKSSKRARVSTSNEESEENQDEFPLQSVVKEHTDDVQPRRTYYQKEYRRSPSVEEYIEQRNREVERFYRGSSRDRARPHPDYQNFERENRSSSRFENQQRPRERYQEGHRGPPQDYHNSRRPREEFGNRRKVPYAEVRKGEPDFYGKGPHGEPWRRGQQDGNNRAYQQHIDNNRGIRRQENTGREYHPRRDMEHQGPRYQPREYEKKDRYQEERVSDERGRDMHRERIQRQDKPFPRNHRERSQSTSAPPRSREPETRAPEERRFKEEKPYRRPSAAPREREASRQSDRDRNNRKREEQSTTEDRVQRQQREPRRSRERESREAKASSPKGRERKSRFNVEEKEYSWGKTEVKKEGKEKDEKEKPNFGLSGKLTDDANTVNGVVIKYTEPDDAKQPKRRWRFYPFKGDKALPILYIHRQSCFLLGREKKVVDIHLEHPSVSKQHAALQFRSVPFDREDGSQGRRIRPYIIDLESANGTFVNNKKIEARRYVELMERDVVKFAFSLREYVLLHENSKDEAQDDDQLEPTIGAAVTTTDQIKREKRAIQETVVDDGA